MGPADTTSSLGTNGKLLKTLYMKAKSSWQHMNMFKASRQYAVPDINTLLMLNKAIHEHGLNNTTIINVDSSFGLVEFFFMLHCSVECIALEEQKLFQTEFICLNNYFQDVSTFQIQRIESFQKVVSKPQTLVSLNTSYQDDRCKKYIDSSLQLKGVFIQATSIPGFCKVATIEKFCLFIRHTGTFEKELSMKKLHEICTYNFEFPLNFDQDEKSSYFTNALKGWTKYLKQGNFKLCYSSQDILKEGVVNFPYYSSRWLIAASASDKKYVFPVSPGLGGGCIIAPMKGSVEVKLLNCLKGPKAWLINHELINFNNEYEGDIVIQNVGVGYALHFPHSYFATITPRQDTKCFVQDFIHKGHYNTMSASFTRQLSNPFLTLQYFRSLEANSVQLEELLCDQVVQTGGNIGEDIISHQSEKRQKVKELDSTHGSDEEDEVSSGYNFHQHKRPRRY